jgi:hypothetical protein
LTPGIYNVSDTIIVKQMGISILGFGHSSRLRVTNPAITLFEIESDRFLLSDVEIDAAQRQTAGSVINATGSQGDVRNVRIDGGNFFDVFTLDDALAGMWSFQRISVVGAGQNCNYVFHLQAAKGTVASTHLQDVAVSNRIKFKTAALVLDTGVDTLVCSNCEMGSVLAQNSLRTGGAPRWIYFTNSLIEAWDGIDLNLKATRDFTFQGYLGTAQTAAVIGPEAAGVTIANSEFVNISRSAVTIAKGALDVNLHDNLFEDTAHEANNRYDTIDVEGGVTDFQIRNNTFKSTQKNLPRHLIHVAGGISDRYVISGNNLRNSVGTPLYDAGRGINRHISDNF